MITTLKEELNVPILKHLTPAEWNIICNYVNVMSPLAIGLDRLQGEKESSAGFILPTLYTIRRKIQNARTQAGDKLKECLLKCFDKQFESQMEFVGRNKDLILASISHPYFKMNWIEMPEHRAIARDMFLAELTNISNQNQPSESLLNDDEDGFFECFGRETRTQVEDGRIEEFGRFVRDSNKDVQMLNDKTHAKIKEIFLKYNTAVASSAPVERLFSQALIIFQPRRNRLSASNFEKALVIKHNKDLVPI